MYIIKVTQGLMVMYYESYMHRRQAPVLGVDKESAFVFKTRESAQRVLELPFMPNNCVIEEQ